MKKSWISVVLSLLFPGLGHLYLGRVKKGVLLIVADIVATLSMSIVVGVFLLPVVYLYAIIDSYKITNEVNEEIQAAKV